jgi:hypothetical protein
MLRLTALPLLVAVGFAQSTVKPPAEVDQALRARISEFYRLHMSAEFRKAEALVAEDTKDYYYNSSKPQYLSFDILQIDYSDNFTRAKAMTLCEQQMLIPGADIKALKMRTPSTWKLENGQWYWYVDLKSAWQTPFGPSASGSGKSGGPPGMPADFTKADFVFNQVKVDKPSVTLQPGESAQVTFTNSAPGPMKVLLHDRAPGVESQLEHGDMKAGEKAVLTLKASSTAKSGVASVRIEQTGEVLKVQVTVK